MIQPCSTLDISQGLAHNEYSPGPIFLTLLYTYPIGVDVYYVPTN